MKRLSKYCVPVVIVWQLVFTYFYLFIFFLFCAIFTHNGQAIEVTNNFGEESLKKGEEEEKEEKDGGTYHKKKIKLKKKEKGLILIGLMQQRLVWSV